MPETADHAEPELHPNLQHVAALLGTWAGEGRGEYPTIDSFEYRESITFGHVGKPFLGYRQHTRSAATGQPLHAESGYWRFPEPGRVEVVMSHPTGIGELQAGTVATDDAGVITIELASTDIWLTPTSKEVSAVARTLRIDGDELTYTVRMAAVDLPLQHHLAATLHRQ